MKTKINKSVKLAATGLFLVVLAINVKVTLDDPFVMLSEDVIDRTTSSTSSSTEPAPCLDQGAAQTSFRDFNSPLVSKCYDAEGIECGRELGCEEDTDAPLRPYDVEYL